MTGGVMPEMIAKFDAARSRPVLAHESMRAAEAGY